MTELTKKPSGSIALTSESRGHLLLDNQLSNVASIMEIAEWCEQEVRYLSLATLDQTKLAHEEMLPNVLSVLYARLDLKSFTPINRDAAVQMLGTLIETFSRRKAENVALLASFADLFNPANDIIGRGLWKPVSKNPAVLAMAIKYLTRTSKFMPTPKELIDAMDVVKSRILLCIHKLSEWVKLMDRADRILFELDRPAWDAAHESSSDDVINALLCTIIDNERERYQTNDEDKDRYRVLNQMYDAKRAAINNAKIATKRIEQTVENLRITACTTPPAKHTQKSKTHEAATLAQHIGAADRKACTDREHR
jgi:hypothetical protein